MKVGVSYNSLSSPVAEAPFHGDLSVAALVHPSLGARLKSFAPTARLCTDVEEVLHMMRERSVRLFVCDPSFASGSGGDVMRAIQARYSSTLVVAYIALTGESVSQLFRMLPHGITECVVYQHDDTAPRFAELLARARMSPLVQSMLDELAPELGRLESTWRDAVADVYRRPMRFRVTDDLAATMNTSRQTVHRRLMQAGLSSPRLLVGSGRVLRAAELLRDRSQTVRRTAEQLGYHRPEHLSSTFRMMTGMRVCDLREGVETKKVVAAIASRLRSPTLHSPSPDVRLG